jgi:hypothetical protein
MNNIFIFTIRQYKNSKILHKSYYEDINILLEKAQLHLGLSYKSSQRLLKVNDGKFLTKFGVRFLSLRVL